MQFAEVILPLNLPKTFTYGIPVQWQELIMPGVRVEVNLGKNKIYSGIVLQTHNIRPEYYTVKPIRSVLDSLPIIQPQQLLFWQWIARYYLCSLGDVMNAALPAHLKLISESLLVWSEGLPAPPTDLGDESYIVAEALHVRRTLTIEEVRQLLAGKNIAKVINELIEKGIAIVTEVLDEKYKVKKESFVFLTSSYESEQALNKLFAELDKAPKQLQLLMQFFQLRQQNGPVAQTALLQKSGCTKSQLNELVKKGVLKIESVEVDRLSLNGQMTDKHFTLSVEQSAALKQIKFAWLEHNVVLLHGITGSGKTLLYISLIKEAIALNKQSLFLLPEIALTTQIVTRLRAYFGDELGVYHSGFNNNERVEIWNKVKEGKYKIIIGARSAIWLPFLDLEYIIIDEEHDTSYKQYDPAPRFHARDAAIYLASLYGAKVLLGSATPSLESIRNAKLKKYAYTSLKQRFGNNLLPQVEIVSARNIQNSLSPILTVPLLESISTTLRSGKQVILFQNKRGYTPVLLCGSCGHIVHCKQCDVAVTYHKSTDKLHCHYCGTKIPALKQCPQCGSNQIIARSFGTEKIEEELQRVFPRNRTARMDWDSVRGKNAANKLIEDFMKGRIDILVGTQMVVKGLDFDNVGLVGILSADSLLSYPDFRVNERGFQLMEQVAGRAGRADSEGRVIIQAYNQKHQVLQWIKDHDFWSFYNAEADQRKQFHYPPFFRLIKITCKHRIEEKVRNAAIALASRLQQLKYIHTQGPSPALVAKIKNYYLQEIWIKFGHHSNKQQQELKENILAAINEVLKANSALQTVVDVDPL